MADDRAQCRTRRECKCRVRHPPRRQLALRVNLRHECLDQPRTRRPLRTHLDGPRPQLGVGHAFYQMPTGAGQGLDHRTGPAVLLVNGFRVRTHL